jgi:class 3 adenylate cyclase/pimeloyl-ACP methyl ester carboxylesterase
MEPQIRYAKTSDGVKIAYYAIGNGPPLLNVEFPSSLLASWKIQQQYYEAASSVFTFISYDARGFGLSDRQVTNFSIDGMVRDIEAVLDAVGIKSARILASGAWTTPVSVAFAARHPDRVSHMVLFWGFARVPASMREQVQALLAHPNADWRFVSESIMRGAQGWDDPDASRDLAALLRESISLDGFKTFEPQAAQWDVTDDLARVTAPTLVINPRDHPSIGAEQAAALAVGLRDARVVLMEGTSSAKRGEEVTAAILPFLMPDQTIAAPVPGASTPPRPGVPGPRGRAASASRTILYTDIEGNTDMLQRLGDDAWRAVLRDHERITRELLRAHDGAEVKTMGDGFMAAFDSATSAVECAIGLQRAFASRNYTAAEPVLVRVGLNAGEPIAEDDDLFGTAVTMAARIMGQGAGGEILVSDVVRALVAGKGFVFGERGEFVPKGFDEGVRLYEVRWRE